MTTHSPLPFFGAGGHSSARPTPTPVSLAPTRAAAPSMHSFLGAVTEPLASGPALSASIGDHERQLMNAIAANALRYGQATEALALVQLSLRYQPNDLATLNLLAQILMVSGNWKEATDTLALIDRLGGSDDPRTHWLRIMVVWRREGLGAAQRLFRLVLQFLR